jgi:hypothetical protein
MKTYDIAFARIEHNVYRFLIDAKDEDHARELAEARMESPDFDWDDCETVHAEEFFSGIDEQDGNDE